MATVCGFRSDGGILSTGSLLVCVHYQVLWTEVLQLPRSTARSSQDSVLMSKALMSLTDILESQVQAADSSLSRSQLSTEDVFWMRRPSSMRRRESCLTYTADVVSEGCTLWGGQHETGLQRWSLCLARICPRCGECLLGIRFWAWHTWSMSRCIKCQHLRFVISLFIPSQW